MVNWVEAQKPLLRALIKLAGLCQQTVEIDSGTTISFWAPKNTLSKKNKTVVPEENSSSKKKKNKKIKPAVVLIHGFAAEGLVTWQFQIGSLTNKYSVYVPDLLFFGGSTTDSTDRSPSFQAQCLATALGRLGVERCTVVGFSYGGMVAFKLAEARPELVESLVVSGSVIAMTDSISVETLERLGFSSSSELLLPESVKGLKALLSVASHGKNLWFPDFIHRDYLKVMFNNRKERKELLEGLVMSNKDAKVPNLAQMSSLYSVNESRLLWSSNMRERILLLWGENDNLFKLELAHNMREQLGDRASLQGIKKAGHLVHIERPCVYTRRLKEFLASVYTEDTKQ